MDSEGHAGEPRWLRDGAAMWWGEIRLFFETAARFARHPGQFGARWAGGQLRAMNPLAFLVLSWPVLLPVDYGLQKLLGWQKRPDLPFVIELSQAIRPYLFLVPVALLLHPLFRLAGSRRRLSTTLGLLLYWMVFAVVGWVLGLAACLVVHTGDWLPTTSMYLTLPWAALALGGAHGVRWIWCLAAAYPACVLGFKIIDVVIKWLVRVIPGL